LDIEAKMDTSMGSSMEEVELETKHAPEPDPDEWEEDEEEPEPEMTPEGALFRKNYGRLTRKELAKHEEFERHRKMHYSMGTTLAKAKELLQQEEEEEEPDDGEDQPDDSEQMQEKDESDSD